MANIIIAEFREYFVIGYPNLVRLNPNIPWKTRGNGAVCIQLQKRGNGNEFHIGSVENGKIINGYSKGVSDNNTEVPKDELTEILERMESIISAHASLEDDTTNPGIVITSSEIPIDLYWSAVREVVKLDSITKQLRSIGAVYKGFKKCRGLIGASAAIAWASQIDQNSYSSSAENDQFSLDSTYELLSYRCQQNWGTERNVDSKIVRELDNRYPSTFNNYDYENQHIAIIPNSPCPVLFGIRGESVAELQGAFNLLVNNDETEPIDKWLLFQTNQGTDDHLIQTNIPNIKPYSSVTVCGRVDQNPKTIPGGHVIFNLEELSSHSDNNVSSITCAAYEPTKGFRNIVRDLLPGDIIKVYGGVRTEPKTINLEKLAIEKLEESKVKVHNPICPCCGRTMKSIGKNKGYRCRSCHEIIKPDKVAFEKVQRGLTTGYYEVPVVARRHLAKPLKRMKKCTGSVSI